VQLSTPLLDACARFAEEVSPEAVERVIRALATDGDSAVDVRHLSGDAAALFAQVCDAWGADASRIDSVKLSLLMAGALHAVKMRRDSRKVELVWSGPTEISSPLRHTEPALLELLQSARESVYLVTFAAYKVPAVVDAINAALARGVRVVFVLEDEEASAGKVDFNPLAFLTTRGGLPIEVYVWPLEKRQRDVRGRHGTLHAKFAVADRARLLVSSANLTEHAFNLNIELGVLVSGGPAAGQAVAHLDTLIRQDILRPYRA
jgi:cardiolipin synthase